MAYFIVNEKCTGCLACVENCPAGALDVKDVGPSRTLYHNMSRCARCATCWRVCPHAAIEFKHLLENRWDEVVTLNLIRCEYCGEPIHTLRQQETLPEKLATMAQALCPQHLARQSSALHFISSAGGKTTEREGKNR